LITQNIFFSRVLTQLTSSLYSISNDLGSLGKLDSNYYARPIDDGTTIQSIYTNTSGQKITNLHDLPGWKTVYGFDKVSNVSAKKIDAYTITGTTGTNKIPTGMFSASADIQKVWPNSCTLSWANAGLLDGGYLKVVATDLGSSIVINAGSLSTSKKYLLRFSVKSAGSVTLGANLRASTYEPLTDKKYWAVSTARNNCEMLFTPSKNDASGAIVFTIDAQQTYYIDNIEVYEAAATPTNPDDSLKFVYNAGKNSQTVVLNGNYVDVKNNKYQNSITLKPYTGAVLIKDGGVTNSLPQVSITSPGSGANFNNPASVNITADASDSDGSISKVEFYNGTTLLNSDNTSPYSYTWNNVGTGNYTLTAKAYDNSGDATVSSPVQISVASPNEPPTVIITSPVNASSTLAPAIITLTADAKDTDGKIAKVEFYNGSTLITTE
jgi:hypothetical protein